MKYISIITALILLFLTSCSSGEGDWEGEEYWENETEAYGEGNFMSSEVEAHSKKSSRKRGKTMIHKLKDPQTGMITETVPLPSSWKVSANGWDGPGGSHVEGRQGANFNGMQGPVPSHIDQVMQREILPKAKSIGYRVDRVIDLPEIAQSNYRKSQQLWKFGQVRETHQVKGIEATFKETGDRVLFVVNFSHQASQYGSFAGYYYHVLSAKARRYEKDKEAVLYALANSKPTPQAVAAYNQKEQARSNQSWAAHRQRMAANQRNFEASQRAASTLSEVGDIIHEGYMNRSRIQDAGHTKTIDGIREELPATNPYTGQQFKVQQGYKFYYMNQYGQVFGTNDPFYNPAQDPNVNNQQWRKVQTPGGY